MARRKNTLIAYALAPALVLVIMLVSAPCLLGQSRVSGSSQIGGQTQVGQPADFSLSMSPSSLAVTAGNSVTATVTVTSISNFSGPVTLVGSNGPALTTYSFGTNPVTPPANSSTTSILTVTTSLLSPTTTCPGGGGGFTITGTSGSLIHTIAGCVAITGPANGVLTIQIFPVQGNSGNVSVNTGSLSCIHNVSLNLCHASYTGGTVVTITEIPNSTTFVGWSGACSGTSTTCTVTINGNLVVNATFNTQVVTSGARTDGCVFNSSSCGVSSPVTGELEPSACSGNASCLANACSGGLTGTQGAAMSYCGGPTSIPPAAGSIVSGTNINGLDSYLVGANQGPMTDPDFGTTILRATDSVMQNSVACLGGGRFGISFAGIGAGSNLVWASDDSKILIKNSGGGSTVLAFDPINFVVTPSSLCGGYFPGGGTFSGTDPHTIYNLVNDQENTVKISGTTGTGITPETVQQQVTNAKAQLLAVNSTFIQLGVVSGNANSSNDWVGATSLAHFTPTTAPPTGTANTPWATSIYKGIICDGATTNPDESVCQKNPNPSCAANSANPLCWYVYYSMLAEFTYLPSMVGDPHFPTCPACSLPQNFNASYNGVFAPSTDGTSFTVVFGDNGQANHTGYNGGGSGAGYVCPNSPGGICQGPVYMVNWTSGKGFRAINTMTDMLTGDWGPGSPGPTPILDQQANNIPGTITGTLTAGDAFKQLTTGALTQLICLQDSTNYCTPSGWTQMFTGVVYGTPDSSHAWQDCGNNYPTTSCSGSNYFTPSAVPTNAPFYYPDVLHDMAQSPNNALASFSMVQNGGGNMKVADSGSCPGSGCAISYTAATQQAVILYSSSSVFSPGQQFHFSGLRGAHASHYNCVDIQHCPTFTAIAIPNTNNTVCPGNGPYCPSGSQGTITISDPTGGGADFTDSENQTGCGTGCPLMYPRPQDENNTNGAFGGTNFYQLGTLLVAADLMATGHHAAGDHTFFQGKFYDVINEFFPWTPATIPHSAGPAPCNLNGSPCGDPYAGPLTPPPNNTNLQLIPFSITDDQHGDQGCHGTTDQCPPMLFTALVCGQAGSGGVGGFPCNPTYTSLWDDEIDTAQNAPLLSSPGTLVGADCSYDSSGSPEPCIYRIAHTYSTGSHFTFTVQNAEGGMSPDGLFVIWPSDWNNTLGCMDGITTYCISSWQATAPNASGTAVTWTTDSASPPNVTITMANQFCPTGGTQYYCAAGGSGASCGSGKTIQSISCGTRAATVGLSGFSESWLGGSKGATLTLGPNTANNWGCDSTTSNAGNCTAFVLANVTGAPASSSGTETGTQKATPTTCSAGVPCPRADMFIGKVNSAHQ